jgi:hypothetical protein
VHVLGGANLAPPRQIYVNCNNAVKYIRLFSYICIQYSRMKKKSQKKLIKLASEALAEHKRGETELLAILMKEVDRTKKYRAKQL